MRVSCAQINELKEAYVDNLLKPQLRLAIEAHIADCDQCRARIALCSRIKVGMGKAVRATLGNPMPSRQQVAAMQAQLEQRISRPSSMRLGRSSVAVAMITLLLTATAVVGALQTGLVQHLFSPDPNV